MKLVTQSLRETAAKIELIRQRLREAQSDFDNLYRRACSPHEDSDADGIKVEFQQAAANVELIKLAMEKAQIEFDNQYFRAVTSKVRKETTKLLDGCSYEHVTLSQRAACKVIADLLATEPERAWFLREISSRLPSIPKTTIRRRLLLLKRDGQVILLRGGTWKAIV